MIELYLSKVTETSESEQAGKLYARVSYKQNMDIHDMAVHMAHHNTAFSEGLIVGVLTDFVKCVREMVLSGNTVKVGNLCIFKATVEANALETLYDAQTDKVASANFTREELKKDVKFSWTDKTKAEIAAAKGDTTSNTPGTGGSTPNPSQGGSSDTGGSTTGGGSSDTSDPDPDGGSNSDE